MRPHKQTFMEISGYPHFENVCSNILQFYLQPTNEHGFGTLFLDALISSAGQTLINNTEEVEVRREESTDEKSRIDLVIEADEYVIGIENKIFASLDNPFDKYRGHLEKLSRGRHICGILLSLRPVKPFPELCGFIPVSYEQFLQEILSNLGSHVLTAQEPHLTFFRDFVRTMQNLQETTAMDQQRLDYFHKNQANIKTLLAEVDSLRGEMRYKVKQIKTLLSEKVLSPYPIKTQGLWQPKVELVAVTYCHFHLSEILSLQVDVCLTLDGWYMEFFNGKGSRDEIRQWITERKIEVEELVDASGSLWRLRYKSERFPYNSELGKVFEWAFAVIEKLVITTP